VIRHELPRLAIGRMLGGSLQARALAFLALTQDEAGTDLAGLRDITKSAASQTGLESMAACEHVLGGRAFDRHSRVNAARSNLHLFGVVEGEDDMIRMGAVRDVAQQFNRTYLEPVLSVLQKLNVDPEGKPVPEQDRVLRVGLSDVFRRPARTARALWRIVASGTPFPLVAWIVRNALADLIGAPIRLLPSAMHPRYSVLPKELRSHARLAEAELRRVRWHYIRLGLVFQLEMVSAQVALQRLGQRIEWLISMLALCHHAAGQDSSQWAIAHLQCLLLRERLRMNAAGLGSSALKALRRAIEKVGLDAQDDRSSLLKGLEPEHYAHPFR
jgi:hypothetical protein